MFVVEYNVQVWIKSYFLKKLNDFVLEYKKGKGGKLVIDMLLDD